jgi:ferredoxin
MGLDPQDSADFDIFFREIPEGYIARVATEKGQALAGGRGFFEEAAADEWNLTRRNIRGGRETPLFNLERVTAGVVERFPDESLWKRVSAKCINCGICTYLCPTCHCFDLSDLQARDGGVRFRCWDSCAFPDFTKMAVHNPREEKWRRYRQRVSHKFNFFYQNFQTIACVGCGRCVSRCPVNLDLRQVLLEATR